MRLVYEKNPTVRASREAVLQLLIEHKIGSAVMACMQDQLEQKKGNAILESARQRVMQGLDPGAPVAKQRENCERALKEVAQAIAQTVGYAGQIEFDTSKPDGAPRKWMDSSRLNALGWQTKVDLRQGLAIAYQDFVNKL